MTNEQIKEIALANDYKEKLQADGTMDLNPYVYRATRAALQSRQKEIVAEMSDLFVGRGKQDCIVIQSCIDVVQEFIDEIIVIENSEVADD